ALPAGSWILTMALTRRLAMRLLLQLRHLGEVEFDGRLPPENVDQDLQLELVLVDLGDGAAEVGEGTLAHPDGLAELVLQLGPALSSRRAFAVFGVHLEDVFDFLT